jgi:hypothetical protein
MALLRGPIVFWPYIFFVLSGLTCSGQKKLRGPGRKMYKELFFTLMQAVAKWGEELLSVRHCFPGRNDRR